MYTFYVYKKDERFFFVKEYFSIYAFMFTSIWLLLNKNWFHFLFITLALVLSNYLYSVGYFSYLQAFLYKIIISIYCGVSAPTLKCEKFLKSGFEFETIVFGKTEIEAKIEFYKNIQ